MKLNGIVLGVQLFRKLAVSVSDSGVLSAGHCHFCYSRVCGNNERISGSLDLNAACFSELDLNILAYAFFEVFETHTNEYPVKLVHNCQFNRNTTSLRSNT